VPIRAVCPGCKAEYLLKTTLLGQQVRCPAPRCHTVFKVPRPSPESTPTARRKKSHRAAPPGQSLGRVGETVPLLPAEKGRRPGKRDARGTRQAVPVQEVLPILKAEEASEPLLEQEPLPAPEP
jgi:hypothetical protein